MLTVSQGNRLQDWFESEFDGEARALPWDIIIPLVIDLFKDSFDDDPQSVRDTAKRHPVAFEGIAVNALRKRAAQHVKPRERAAAAASIRRFTAASSPATLRAIAA